MGPSRTHLYIDIVFAVANYCRPGQDRQPLLPDGGLPFNFPVVMSMQVDGESITAGEVREGQAALRQKNRQDVPGQGVIIKWYYILI